MPALKAIPTATMDPMPKDTDLKEPALIDVGFPVCGKSGRSLLVGLLSVG